MSPRVVTVVALSCLAMGLSLGLAAPRVRALVGPARASVRPMGHTLPHTRAADMIHAVLEADRAVYTQRVINRLTKEQQVLLVEPATGVPEPLAASEDWKSRHGALPLPAQMFRMGSELVLERGAGFSYVLLSAWPINDKNRPRTPVEHAGLAQVASGTDRRPYYGEDELDGKRYFTAVYPDVAIAPACVDCHNQHPDSPRKDFKKGDVMGGVVIRIPLD
jgi:hypothetical protein